MAGGLTKKWSMAQAWAASVEVTAAAYDADPRDVAVQSRGRGPRPFKKVWEARKIAVYLAVVLSDCGYAELGRLIGLHRDTVASHCADVREAADVDRDEVSLVALEAMARGRLGQFDRQRIDAMRAQLALLENVTGDLPLRTISSDSRPTLHPTDFGPHETVIGGTDDA